MTKITSQEDFALQSPETVEADILSGMRDAYPIGMRCRVDARMAVVHKVNTHGVFVEFCDGSGIWAYDPTDVSEWET